MWRKSRVEPSQGLPQQRSCIGRRATDIVAEKNALIEELRAEQRIGDDIGAVRDIALIKAAGKAIRPLQKMQNKQQPIRLCELKAAAVPLKRALKANCMDEARLAAGENDVAVRASAELRSLFRSLLRLIDYAQYKALAERSRMIESRQRGFAPNELPATKFGNLAAGLRGFCESTFQLDFDFLWPIVQIVVQTDFEDDQLPH